jgi:hypothetical protein
MTQTNEPVTDLQTFEARLVAFEARLDYCLVCGGSRDEADDGCPLNEEDDVESDEWEEENCLALLAWRLGLLRREMRQLAEETQPR